MQLPESARYNFPTTIHFGSGARKKIAQLLKENGCRKPCLVTDRFLAALPFVSEMKTDLESSGFQTSIFSGVQGNPVKSQVTDGVRAYQAAGCDCIIGLGGGAAIDVAKAILLMIHHPGDLFDYEDGKPDAREVDREIPYFVAIPTTAGTGSETGRSTVISDDVTKIKKIIFSPRLLAKTVIVDPDLTVELPANVTASTGMDALTHLMESYLAKGFNPLCDGIAIEGIRLTAGSLEACVRFASAKTGRTPEHLYHRGMMLNAALMGAVSFQKGLGVNHSCAHALSTVCDMHHGLANGIMLPYTMQFNLESSTDRFRIMSETVSSALGQKFDGNPAFIINWIRELNTKIGIPAYLTDVGVKKEQLEALLDAAVHDACHPSNPRTVTREDFKNLFLSAMK